MILPLSISTLFPYTTLFRSVDDEANMIDNGPFGAALSLSIPEVQVDIEPWKHDHRVSGRHEQFPTHGEKQLFVRFNIFRGDVPVTHRDTALIEFRRLCCRGAGNDGQSNQQ